MAYLIKNTSALTGSVLINGKWESITPGKSLKAASKPKSFTSGIKVFTVSDKPVEVPSGKRGHQASSTPTEVNTNTGEGK